MSLGPIVSCPTLSKTIVVRLEKVAHCSSLNGIHGSRFQIDKNSSWDVPFRSLIVIHHQPFALDLILVLIRYSIWIHTMFISYDFPKFAANLVATLSSLDVHNFTHFAWVSISFLLRNCP